METMEDVPRESTVDSGTSLTGHAGTAGVIDGDDELAEMEEVLRS
jgi:hypothetical protein